MLTCPGWGGGLSEHVVVPEYAVVPIPDNVGLDIAGKIKLQIVEQH